MKLAFIGCGNLGSAILGRVLSSEFISRDKIIVYDRSPTHSEIIKNDLGVLVTPKPNEALRDCDVVLLAVRPQDFQVASREIDPFTHGQQIVVSVMAGTTIDILQKELPKIGEFVRCMPNLPVKIGKGVIPYICSKGVSQEDRLKIVSLFSIMGTPIPLENESEFSMMTALSGSGPGYVFLFIESLIKAALELGVRNEIAEQIVSETIIGAVEYWRSDHRSATELRQGMRLKGGTTEAAYHELESSKVSESITKAVKAAFNKAEELAKA